MFLFSFHLLGDSLLSIKGFQEEHKIQSSGEFDSLISKVLEDSERSVNEMKALQGRLKICIPSKALIQYGKRQLKCVT